MKEKPILFNSEMVRAILRGDKLETRRVIKPPFELHKNGYLTKPKGNQRLHPYECPYGEVGDQLWVRETFMLETEQGIPTGGIIYRATDKPEEDETPLKWKPSIFMPREASRIQLEVTGIKIERLQEIDYTGAMREGIERSYDSSSHLWFKNYGKTGDSNFKHVSGAIKSFKSLWNSINEKRGFGWLKNPWVWVVEFKKI